ncbi:prolyl oligopeptidase family serine peptidase [Chitinophaga sp. G-6-1-13]|uniref:Prolyl oligopeptidase family serine peptidase n=1 Tax=Chitinophaga fulva TaxID=2728842 RepID=A0A848GRH5_9BACT|nr:prolyl oligopeptidase family serine peptidase [Chitinophaga fulva]NML40607.1 prolyl oligopeptidase family serine peptidase [Chitinophaga fulva]
MRKFLLCILTLSSLVATAQSPLPWDLSLLRETPPTYPADSCQVPGFRSFFYEGLTYKSNPTRVFAYYKTPAGTPPPGGWPAVICVHGGGGTAFPAWVQAWVDHGFAAIAMDLEGHLPSGSHPNRPAHAYGGPPRITTFGDIELAKEEQWFYHAVADVSKAMSLLRSFKEINPLQIGIHGISWGGVITSTVIGIDDRFAFAIPVYGCGYLYQTTNPGFKIHFDAMTPKQLETYKQQWDPSVYLIKRKAPVLWVTGTNDPAFPLDIWQQTTIRGDAPQMELLTITSKHGHRWEQPEIFAFAQQVIKGTPALPKFSIVHWKGDQVTLSLSEGYQAAKAVLCYTTDTGVNWQQYQWHTVPATVAGQKVKAALPAGTAAFFFNITCKDSLLYSSHVNPVLHL